MGACNSLKAERRVIIIQRNIPKFIYLNVKKALLHEIEDQVCTTFRLPEFKIYNKSAIGTLPDQNILIGGGIKPNKKPSKILFQINPFSHTITRLAPLKLAVFLGNFYMVNSELYYFSSDLRLPHQILRNKTWEILNKSFVNLHLASIYVVGSTVYFAFGIKPNKRVTKKIYSIDLSLLTEIKYNVESIKTPLRLRSPIVRECGGSIIVIGGHKANNKLNYNIFQYQNSKWKKIQGPEYGYSKNSCISVDDLLVLISKFNKMIVINANAFIQLSDLTMRASSITFHTVVRSNTFVQTKIEKYRRNSCELQGLLNNFKTLGETKTSLTNPIYEMHSSESGLSESSSDDEGNSFALNSPIRIQESLKRPNDGETIDTPDQLNFRIKLFSASSELSTK